MAGGIDGIGRRAGFRFLWATVWVRVPYSAYSIFAAKQREALRIVRLPAVFCERSEIHSHENRISFILTDSQIFFGNGIRGMVINVHQKRRRRALLPGVIAERFAQGMAADVGSVYGSVGRPFDDAECLGTA